MSENRPRQPVPPLRITDPAFVYVDSAHTDLRKTFARVRARISQERDPVLTELAAMRKERFG